jgi:hypothetical protein
MMFRFGDANLACPESCVLKKGRFLAFSVRLLWRSGEDQVARAGERRHRGSLPGRAARRGRGVWYGGCQARDEVVADLEAGPGRRGGDK